MGDKPDLKEAIQEARGLLEGPDPERLQKAIASLAAALDRRLHESDAVFLAHRVEALRAASRGTGDVSRAYLAKKQRLQLWFEPGDVEREDATPEWNAMVAAFERALSSRG
jgi:hypothetical protein